MGTDSASRTRTLSDGEAATGSGWERTAGGTIGRYRIEQRLGAGAMGVVYAGYDPKLDRPVAIKLVHPSRAASELSQERFATEARAMARLSHPNVVEIFDYGVDGDVPYLVMERLEARTLRELMREPMPHAQRMRLMIEAGRGLAAAHEHRVVHRDFKPSNVLIADGRARVADFGLALDVAPTEDGPSPRGAVGTPAYMAPEQHRGDRVDARSDQYSFCLVLYELLTERSAFPAARGAQLCAAKEAGPVDLDEGGLALPVAAVIRRGLAPDPADRWPDLPTMLTALQARRRNLVLPIAIAGVAVAASIAFAMTTGPNRCEADRARLGGAWDEIAASQLEAGFIASESPHAGATWTRVQAILDAQADTWLQAYADVCLASEDDGDQLHDAKLACLERSRKELADTVKKVGPSVDRAVGRVSGLRSPGRCRELEPEAEPRIDRNDLGPAARQAHDEAERHMLAAKTKLREGDAAAALESLEAAIQHARGLDNAAVQAVALTKIGNLFDSAGDPERARVILLEAAEHARAARRDDRLAGVMIHLAWVEGIGLGDAEAGIRRSREAQALIERIGGRPQLEAARLNNHATILHGMGQPDEALAAIREGRDAWGRFDPQTPAEENLRRMAVANIDHNIGTMLYNLSRHEEAELVFVRARDGYYASYGADHPAAGETLIGLCSTREDLGDLDGSRTAGLAAAALLEHHSGPQLAKALAHIGYTEYEMGSLDSAADRFKRAADLLGDAPESWTWRTNLAEVMIDQGRLDEADRLAREAIERLDRLGAGHADARVVARRIRGIVSLRQGRPSEALEWLEAAKAISDEHVEERAKPIDTTRLERDIAEAKEAQASATRTATSGSR